MYIRKSYFSFWSHLKHFNSFWFQCITKGYQLDDILNILVNFPKRNIHAILQ